jgi:LEA14-like dessication related protein
VLQTLRHTLLLLTLALAACAGLPPPDFDEPEVRLISLRPLGIENMEARFEIRLRVINPNPMPITIEGLYTEVFLRERRAMVGTSPRRSAIPAYGEGEVELQAGISMLESLALLRELTEQQPREGLPYTLKTKLSLAGLPVALRLEHSGLVPTPR